MTTQAPASTSASTKDPKCNCPYMQQKPCDVREITIKVTRNLRADPSSQSKVGFSFAGDFDPAKVREIKTTKNHHRHGASKAAMDKLGKSKATLLSKYDLVIETTAQFAMGDKPPQNSVDIELDVVWEGTCCTDEHGKLSMRTLSAPVGAAKHIQTAVGHVDAAIGAGVKAGTGGHIAPKPTLLGNKSGVTVTVSPPPKMQGNSVQLGQSIFWARNTKKVKLTEVYGQPSDFDLAKPSGPGLSSALRMLRMCWAFLTPMDFEFTADTHGVAEDKARTPNDQLLALVRVYRETTFGIAMKFPPGLKKVEQQGQRKIDEKKERETYYLISGKKPGEDASGKPADEKYRPLAYELALKVNDIELKVHERTTYEQAERDKIAKAAKQARGDRNFIIAMLWHQGDWVAAIKMVWEDLVKAMHAAREAITKFFDWTKRFPQCGWKLEYEMTLFGGSMGLKFSQGDGDLVDGRYYPLKWKGNIEIKLTVLEVKSKLSFGIMVDFGAVGSVDVRVFGDIVGTVEAGFEKYFMNADPDDGEKTVKIVGSVTGRLGAIAAVESFIYTWKREIFIQGGLKVAGTIKWEAKQTSYAVNLTTLPVVWQFTAVNGRTKDSAVRVHTLCQEQHLMGYKDTILAH